MRFIGIIFITFIGLIVYGWSLPQTFVFEQSTAVSADADIIYEDIVDVTRMRTWAPYLSVLSGDDIAITGAERGNGQIINWRNANPPFNIGTQNVLAVTPPYFVQSRFSSPPYEGSIIYALNESLPGEDVTVLFRLDIDSGDFPYFNRVKLKLKQSAINEELSRALSRLKTITEQG